MGCAVATVRARPGAITNCTFVYALQEHYVFLLGGAIFLELAGGTLFLLNYDLGAYFLVTSAWIEPHWLQNTCGAWTWL